MAKRIQLWPLNINSILYETFLFEQKPETETSFQAKENKFIMSYNSCVVKDLKAEAAIFWCFVDILGSHTRSIVEFSS